MSLESILNLALPIVYALVGLALIWFVIELVMTVRKARSTVTNIEKKINPTLDHVEEMAKSLEPAVKKVDPLVDRVSLTVDAANLEVMRVDQILEDVSNVTSTASNAADAIDKISSAPVELVNTVTRRVRTALQPVVGSDESRRLGEQKDEAAEGAQGIEEGFVSKIHRVAVQEKDRIAAEEEGANQGSDQALADTTQAGEAEKKEDASSSESGSDNPDSQEGQSKYYTYKS
ncbi:MAG: DUF948 domain-containing protein [Eggerthellaceae bacterium]|jgi:uncharacterized protein YoxC